MDRLTELEWFSDPAHGWLRVPLELIGELGIANQISQYSYYGAPFGYLEEDQDAGVLIDAMKRANRPFELVEPMENCSNTESWIRNLPSWREKQAEFESVWDARQPDHNIGVNLIALLGLDIKHNGRVDTAWGDKTPVGLARTVRRIMAGEEA